MPVTKVPGATVLLGGDGSVLKWLGNDCVCRIYDSKEMKLMLNTRLALMDRNQGV